MRAYSIRLSLVLIAVLSVAGMTAVAAGQSPALALTMTAPPLQSSTPTPAPRDTTPTPAAQQQQQQSRQTVIVPGRIYEGNFAGAPVDFVLNAELGQLFVLDVTTPDFDAVLEVYDSEGTQVARDDDGGAGNMPFLIFVAPASGEFKVTLLGYSENLEGGYILRVQNEVVPLPYAEAQTVEFDGRTSTIYSFEGERGEVINLTASSGDSVDTTLRILGPDGVEAGYVDDYEGVDPEFRRFILPDNGRYFVVHAPYSENAVGEVALLLEKTRLIRLSAEPTRIEMTSYTASDVYSLDVVAGETYVIMLSSNTPADGSLQIRDLDSLELASLNFYSLERVTLAFRATSTGAARINVTVSDADAIKPLSVTISGSAEAE